MWKLWSLAYWNFTCWSFLLLYLRAVVPLSSREKILAVIGGFVLMYQAYFISNLYQYCWLKRCTKLYDCVPQSVLYVEIAIIGNYFVAESSKDCKRLFKIIHAIHWACFKQLLHAHFHQCSVKHSNLPLMRLTAYSLLVKMYCIIFLIYLILSTNNQC